MFLALLPWQKNDEHEVFLNCLEINKYKTICFAWFRKRKSFFKDIWVIGVKTKHSHNNWLREN